MDRTLDDGLAAVSVARRAADGEESRWLDAARRGDELAFERLVAAWESTIYNLCLRMLGDKELAADATQEAFLNAYKGMRRFRGGARFSSWVYRIASNVCLTRLRAAPRNLERVHPSAEPVDERGGPEERLRDEERRHRVRSALGTLRPDHRIVVELKVYQELTFDRIAVLIDVPESTVKARFYAALQTLRHRLVADEA